MGGLFLRRRTAASNAVTQALRSGVGFAYRKSRPPDLLFNEAHLTVHEASCRATHIAELCPTKRAFGSRRIERKYFFPFSVDSKILLLYNKFKYVIRAMCERR